MAVFMPNNPPRTVSTEVSRVLRALRSLPDRDYIVWQRLPLGGLGGPEFMILKGGTRALLVKVSPATPGDARKAVQPELLGDGPAKAAIGVEEREALAGFLDGLVPGRAAPANAKPPGVIVFPSISERDLRPAASRPRSDEFPWIAAEQLRAEAATAWVEEHLGPPLDDAGLAALRKAFTPEVVVPAAFTVRGPIERNTSAGLTDYLLDYDQEWVLKCDLELSQEAGREAKDLSVRLINGVAGSGKSLIIVYRAHLLRRCFPDKRILVLTHNRPLIQDLEARYLALSGGDTTVEWRTFLSWCLSQWPNRSEDIRPIGRESREKILAEIAEQHLAGTAITPRMLEGEIDWFKDRLLTRRGEYLSADRTGRGFALVDSMRHRMFDAMQAYQERLDQLGRPDWGDVPRRMWGFMQAGKWNPPRYDAVLVDEAQFFAPLWFEIIKTVLSPETGHLFLVADPTQGFLRRGQSWLSSGLEVRGRSHRLDRSYRTTRKILDFATWLYRTRVPHDDEDIVAPDLRGMPEGVVPVVIPLTSPQDEETRILNEVQQLVQAGVRRRDILIIHTEWEGVEHLVERLNAALGARAARDPKEPGEKDQIRVCTLNAVTGLESPIVFLAGLKALQEEEQSLRVSDEEREALIRDNTRKIYMAITRAGQRVVITYCGELPDWLGRATEQPEKARSSSPGGRSEPGSLEGQRGGWRQRPERAPAWRAGPAVRR